VETASVAAKNVRSPERNVPRATLIGTGASAVVYMLSLIAVFGIVPDNELQKSTAPFSTAVNHMFGGTVWGNVMAAVVIISGIGALNSWTMVTAEMPRAAAQDGLFSKRFEELNSRGMPAFGIIVSTALASIAILINYLGANGETVFTSLVLMTGITVAIPYSFSAAAQIKWRIADKHQIEKARLVRDMIVAVLSLVFSILFIYFSRDTGHSFWVYWSPYFLTLAALLLGIPVYRRERKRMKDPGQVPPIPESERVAETGQG
jgi:basic amino acid/polyamine antiporter, APA family